jgi:hypothetical protein
MTDPMMTLQDALAEVKAGNVRRWGGVDTKPDAVATIINAAASGKLTLTSDADLALALVVKQAATVGAGLVDGNKEAAEVEAAILALAPADALAEVEKLKAERDAAIRLRDEAIEKYAAGADKRLADQDRAEAAEAEVQALKVERDEWKRLYWLARSFAVHDDNCTINRHPHYRDCSCGLRAALTTKDTP